MWIQCLANKKSSIYMVYSKHILQLTTAIARVESGHMWVERDIWLCCVTWQMLQCLFSPFPLPLATFNLLNLFSFSKVIENRIQTNVQELPDWPPDLQSIKFFLGKVALQIFSIYMPDIHCTKWGINGENNKNQSKVIWIAHRAQAKWAQNKERKANQERNGQCQKGKQNRTKQSIVRLLFTW